MKQLILNILLFIIFAFLMQLIFVKDKKKIIKAISEFIDIVIGWFIIIFFSALMGAGLICILYQIF